ncbi:MAG: alpha/beta hydrolase [Thermoguttaceae bacterium]|nr:alpha/beta hydrolase [Thermoguttaceae bacterium]
MEENRETDAPQENATQSAEKKPRKFWRRLLLATGVLLVLILALAALGILRLHRSLTNMGFYEPWSESDGTIVKRIKYGEKDWQTFDLYVPATAVPEVAGRGVVCIHGGAWKYGTSMEEAFICKKYAKRGYACASLNYMLYGKKTKSEYSCLAIMDEIDAALAKFKSEASARGFDVERIALTGMSAGAHLAMMYAYSRASTAPLDVAFVAPRVGPSDLHVETWSWMKPESAAQMAVFATGGKLTVADVLNKTPEAEAAIAAVSPASLVKADSPPTLAAYAAKDILVRRPNYEKMKEALEKSGARFDLVFFPDSNHILGNNPEKTKEYWAKFDDYLVRYLLPPREPSPETPGEGAAL